MNTPGLNPLRDYQLDVVRAVMDSVLHQRGHTFTVEMSRQSGKNESSAQLQVILATTIAGTHNIKLAPTAEPQLRISKTRLNTALAAARVPHFIEGNSIHIPPGATQLFLSAAPEANKVGHTATHLLELDEAQDIDAHVFDRELRPMAAANNATTVLWGTTWDDHSLLHLQKQNALRLQRLDNIRRVFVIPWTVPAATLPLYRRYVEGERDRLGADNPDFYTQYELRPVPSKGRLFTDTHRKQLAGTYLFKNSPPAGAHIAAGLDVAGGSDTQDPEGHDRTVLTLGAVTPAQRTEPVPANHGNVLAHYSWKGTPLADLVPALISILDRWKVERLHVDATGLGEHTASILQRKYSTNIVEAVKFTRTSKSDIGLALITAVTTAHLQTYNRTDSEDSTTFWHECDVARADYLPGQLMAWYVDEADGHDDYITSLALFVDAVNSFESRTARGRDPWTTGRRLASQPPTH